MFWESKWVGSKSYAVIEKYFQEKMKAAENTTFWNIFPSMAVSQCTVDFIEYLLVLS